MIIYVQKVINELTDGQPKTIIRNFKIFVKCENILESLKKSKIFLRTLV